ncbi:MAG: hypothetical protein ACK575_13590 [Cyanobacteriota bacterium]
MPGLQQLLGDRLEILRIGRCIDGPTETLDLKLLADREFHC